jgi:hypothetical protein
MLHTSHKMPAATAATTKKSAAAPKKAVHVVGHFRHYEGGQVAYVRQQVRHVKK